MGKQQHVT